MLDLSHFHEYQGVHLKSASYMEVFSYYSYYVIIVSSNLPRKYVGSKGVAIVFSVVAGVMCFDFHEMVDVL